MKIFPNAHNILSRAIVAARNPVPSESLYTSAFSKTGGGVVTPAGAYTGQDDATFEVEILNDTIVGTPRVSSPTFSGVGNAVMSDVTAVGGTAAQSIVVTLADLGTETRSAYTPFQGYKLQAKTAGADANYIQIEIDQSGLTRTAMDAALLADLVAGTNEYRGDEWDFGGKPRNPDGTIPEDTARLSFGDDPTVYRQFKVFGDNGYVYSFTPAPLRTVPRGSIVKTVTGGRTMTVTHTLGAAAAAFVPSVAYTLGQRVVPTTPNGHWYEVTIAGTAGTEPTWPTNGTTVATGGGGGVTFIDRGVHTNTYASIETLFDALDAINSDADSLIYPTDPVVNNLQFGGMGITDLSVRTGAYVQSITKDGSNSMRTAPLSVDVVQGAPTETLTIRCSIGAQLNEEVFEVNSSLRGALALAVTGVPYVDDYVSFTVPLLEEPTVAPVADISTKFSTSSDPKAAACVSNLFLGSLATPRVFNFEVQYRTEGCNCNDAEPVVGSPNPIYLGTDPGVESMDDIPAALQDDIADLWEWYAGFTTDNTLISSASTSYEIEHDPDSDTDYTSLSQTYSAVMKVDVIDIEAARGAVDMFASTLYAMHNKYTPSAIPTDAMTAYDTAFAGLVADFTDLEDNAGAEFWSTLARQVATTGAPAGQSALPIYRRLFVQNFQQYLVRYKAQLEHVLVIAGIQPPFETSTDLGTDPWTDHKTDFWLVATDSNLLPIQPGYYYHSAYEVGSTDGTTRPTVVAARLFGLGVSFACAPVQGDTFQVIIGETGASLVGYQQGDNAVIDIAAGSPVQLGGGQIGNDTQTWTVVGSVAGALADYALLKTTPPTYSNGGIGFKITPGGIGSVLGDAYTFYVEGGQFQWRKNAGSWSSATQIASTVALSDGVSAVFNVGTAPSFIDGDTYTMIAEAVNGGPHLESLTYGGIVTTEITESMVKKHRHEATLTTAETASECMVWFHQPSEVGAVVTVRGFADSADIEGTEVVTGTANTNGSRALRIELDEPAVACEKWTITYYSTGNTPTTLGWSHAFVGHPFAGTLVNGRVTLGDTQQQWRAPTKSGFRADMGATVEFEALSSQNVEDLKYAIDYAATNDDGRVGIMLRPSAPAATRARDAYGAAHTTYPEYGICTIDGDTLTVRDELSPGFQAVDTTQSLLAVTLDLVPV